ncbi:F-box only protein 34 [Sigmodon hispidus]
MGAPAAPRGGGPALGAGTKGRCSRARGRAPRPGPRTLRLGHRGASVMHLKPYWKLQKRDRPLQLSKDTLRMPELVKNLWKEEILRLADHRVSQFLDKVAKLESERLKQQGQPEPGTLSGNNSFRQNVGRVLLANGAQANDKNEEGATDAPDTQIHLMQSMSVGEGPSTADHCSGSDQAWDGQSQSCPSLSAGVSFHIKPGQQRAMKNCNRHDIEMADTLEEPLPRMPIFLSPGPHQQECSQLDEHTTQKASEASKPQDAAKGNSVYEEKDVSEEPAIPAASVVDSTLPVLEPSSWTKQVSQDFLETRFKIQHFLEPQQCMACLPHHIMGKIFRLLLTRSLVLKCTCRYFKFIIVYYNVRPADSWWVRDPRCRKDPYKQCKKKYVKGDVFAPQTLLPGVAWVLDVLPPVSEGFFWLYVTGYVPATASTGQGIRNPGGAKWKKITELHMTGHRTGTPKSTLRMPPHATLSGVCSDQTAIAEAVFKLLIYQL